MPDSNPYTNVHTFLVAQPGVWLPVTMKSPIREPSTWEEYQDLITRAAEDLGTDPRFVKYMCTIELINEPWVDEKPKESPIVVPNKNLIVPPGVRR